MRTVELGFVTPKKGEVIYLIDDDERVLEALSELIESLGRRVVCFATAKEYLDRHRTDSAACPIRGYQTTGHERLGSQHVLEIFRRILT